MKRMTKEQKIYCKIGQAVCSVIGGALFIAIPMAICNLGGYIASLF